MFNQYILKPSKVIPKEMREYYVKGNAVFHKKPLTLTLTILAFSDTVIVEKH